LLPVAVAVLFYSPLFASFARILIRGCLVDLAGRVILQPPSEDRVSAFVFGMLVLSTQIDMYGPNALGGGSGGIF
jgi:hypothetical protein